MGEEHSRDFLGHRVGNVETKLGIKDYSLETEVSGLLQVTMWSYFW